VLRLLFWRLLGIAAALLTIFLLARLFDGGAARALRASGGHGRPLPAGGLPELLSGATADALGTTLHLVPMRLLALVGCAGLAGLAARGRARGRRRYVRMRIVPYRNDVADAHALTRMFAALQSRLLRRWWERLIGGQPSVALEIHHRPAIEGAAACAWMSVTCPVGHEASVEAALQVAYPNMRLGRAREEPGSPPCLMRLKKRRPFVSRAAGGLERFEREPEPMMDRLLSAMAATSLPGIVQLSLTPAPLSFQGFARWLYKHREAELGRRRAESGSRHERSMLDDLELRGGLEIQHRPLFFADIRVVAPNRRACEQIASVLRAQRGENELVTRTTAFRHGALGGYARRILRGEGNPLPGLLRGVFATNELAALWQLPSADYTRVPFSRSGLPLAPAPPEVLRPLAGRGTLRDALGPVSIHVSMRRQNTAVPGTVEQGKSSYLVATVAEDLERERCAVIVLDPKGDAADAALSAVPEGRTCTLLDFAHPTCGFNPLAVDAPADVIADYVVAALKNLFTDEGVIKGL
jgi:hypothetical protein